MWCTLSELADVTELGGVDDRSSRWDGCHPEGPERLDIWSDRNFSKFSKHCKDLQPLRKSSTHRYVQGAMQTERRLVEMNLGLLMNTKLSMNWRGVLAVWDVTGISAALEVLPSKEGAPSPLLSTGEILSEVLHSALGSLEKTDKLLERVQKRTIKMMEGLEHLSYEERLTELRLCNLEKRRLKGESHIHVY